MGQRTWRLTTLVLTAVLILVCQLTQAQIRKPAKGYFGIKAGLLSPGDYRIDGFDWETEAQYSFEIFMDFPVISRLYAGAAIDIHEVRVRSVEESKPLLDFSLAVKYRLPATNGSLIFSPGASGGYSFLQEYMNYKDIRMWTVKLFMEFIWKFGDKVGLLVEMGPAWAPSGGNDDHDITAGPMFLLRGGIVFQ